MLIRYIVAGIVQRGDQVIVGKKAKGQKPYPNVWHTPGGGVEDIQRAQQLFAAGDYDDDYFHQELKRELQEELNVEIDLIQCLSPKYFPQPQEAEVHNKHGELTHYFFLEYLCTYAGGELKAGDDLAEAKWVNKTDLKTLPLTPPSQSMYRTLGWID